MHWSIGALKTDLNKETEPFDQKKYAEKAKKLHAKFAFNMGLDK